MNAVNLLDIPAVSELDLVDELSAADKGATVIVVLYTAAFAATPLFAQFLAALTTQIVPCVPQPCQLFRCSIDANRDFAIRLLQHPDFKATTFNRIGLLWVRKPRVLALGDAHFVSAEVLRSCLLSLVRRAPIKVPPSAWFMPPEHEPPARQSPPTAGTPTSQPKRPKTMVGRWGKILGCGLFLLFGVFVASLLGWIAIFRVTITLLVVFAMLSYVFHVNWKSVYMKSKR